MKKTIGWTPALVLALCALVVGAGAMWVLEKGLQDHDVLELSLAKELETTGLCANGLALNGANDRDRLARLLEQRLDSAVRQASILTDQGVRLRMAAPNLRESVQRAAAYYSSVGNPDRQRCAEALLAALGREQ